MDTIGQNSNFAAEGKDFANKTAEKMQGGLNNAKHLVDEAGNTLSGKAASFRNTAENALGSVKEHTKEFASQAKGAVGNATQQVRDTTSDAADGVVTYTKENPVKALLFAGAAGALIVALIQALTPSRE